MSGLLKTSPIPLLTLMLSITWGPITTVATPIHRATTQVNTPICYLHLSGGKALNLDQFCGSTTRHQVENLKRGLINLLIDTNGDGVADQLMLEMQQLRTAISQAKTPQARAALRQQLDRRLPYSDQARQLRQQERDLTQQKLLANSWTQKQKISQQITAIRQKLLKDASYRNIIKARSRVYQQLNR